MSEYRNYDDEWLLHSDNYIKHVSAMTGENLHSKSDIAAELAYRDDLIEQLQQRVAQLESERETKYEKWQAKYQQLKDGMVLTPCYECGTPVHEVSPRSRCCMCEYGRANFNEKENSQLRELEAQVPKWISVEDELPEDNQDILMVDELGKRFSGRGRVLKATNGYEDTPTARHTKYTHWMPLPQPPKEQDHE